MPPKTNTWDKILPKHVLIVLQSDGQIDHVEFGYAVEDTGDSAARKDKSLMLGPATPRIPLARNLVTALLADATSMEGL